MGRGMEGRGAAESLKPPSPFTMDTTEATKRV